MTQRKGSYLRLVPSGNADEGDNDLPFDDSTDGGSASTRASAGGQSGEIASGVEGSVSGVMIGQNVNVVVGHFITGEMQHVDAASDDDHDGGDDNLSNPFLVEDATNLNLGELVDQLKAEGLEMSVEPGSFEKANIQANAAKWFVTACKKHNADQPGNMAAVILELFESALADIQTAIVQTQLKLRGKQSHAPREQNAYARFIAELQPTIQALKTDLQKEVQEILEESQRYLPHQVKTDFAHYSLLIFEAFFKNVDADKVARKQTKGATLADVLGSAYSSLTDFCSSIKGELIITDAQKLTPENLLVSRAIIPSSKELFDRAIENERLTIEDVEAIGREIEAIPHYTVAEINEIFKELNARTSHMWSDESLRQTLLGSIREYVMAGIDGEKQRQKAIADTVVDILDELEDEEQQLADLVRKHPVGSSASLRRGHLSPEPTAATGDDDDAQPRALTPEELEAIEADVDLKFDLLDGDEAEPNETGTPAAKDAVEIVEEGPSSEDVDFDEDAIASALDELESKPGDDKQPEAVVVAKISIGSSTYRTFVEKILSRRDLVAQVLANHPEPIDQITVLTGGIRLIMRPINIHVEEGRMEPSARDGLYQSVAQLLEQSGVQPYIVQFCLWAYENVIDDESIRAAYTKAVSGSGEQTANAEQVQPTNHEEKPTPDLVETTFNSLREQCPDVDANFVDTLVVSVRNALSAGRSGQDKRSRLNNAYEELAADIQAIKNSTSPDSAKNLLHQGLSSLGFTEIAIDIMFEYSGRVTQFHSYLTDTIAGDVFVATFTDDAEEVEDPVIPEELPSIVIDQSLKKAQLDGRSPFPSMQKFGQQNKE